MSGGPAILVTGPTGTVGRHVVESLVEAGATVRVALRNPGAAGLPAAFPAASPAAEAVHFDFADPASWLGALDGVDRLFLIRPPAISDVITYLRPVIRLAASRGLRHVVFLSLIGVNRVMPHWQVERDIEAAGLSYTFLRPSFFAQNLLTAYLEDIRDRDQIRLPAGRGKTAFVDTRDIAAVAAQALIQPERHTGRAYSLTGEQALGYSEVAALLTMATGRPIRYVPIGFRRYRRELLAAGFDPVYVRVQLGINLVARLGLAGRTTATMGELLGRPPRTLAEFVTDYADVWNPGAIG